MRKNIIIVAILVLGFGSVVFAAPYFRQEAGLVPLTDSTYYLGTTTPSLKAWKGLIVDEVCLSGDCQTAWPAGGSSFPFTPVSYGNATSTTLGFLNGFLSTASSTFTASTNFPSGIWNSSGNVGIGTTSPSAKLTVWGSDTGANIMANFVNSASTSVMSILNNGNVGIGTTTPGYKLQVAADGAGGGNQIAISGATNPLNRLYIGYDTTSNYARLQAITEGTATRALALNPDGGNVGIGTTNPLSSLHVQTSNASSLGFARMTTSDYADGTTGSGLIFKAGANTGNTYSQINALSSGFNATANLILNATGGNVGIGTTSPYKLLSIGGDTVIGSATAGGTLGDLYLPKLGTAAGTFLAADATGKLIATSTPVGSGTVTSIATTYPLTGGTITTTGTLGLAFGTTTSNTWAGTQTFTNQITGSISGTAASLSAILANTLGGTGKDSSAWTGSVGVNGGTWYQSATTTAGTGLTYSGNAFSVNTSQNIATLSNLTGNGFVKTSGGNGTLSIDTTTYESGLTAGDGLTRTVNDFDCDTASGSVFGCLSSADWTTFNSKQATISATYPVTLTGAAVGLAFGTTTSNTWAGVQTLTNAPIFSALTGVLKGNGASALTVAADGTDFTLVTGTICSGTDKVSAIAANGDVTCSADTGGATVGTVSTSTTPVIGNLAYWTGTGYPSTLGTVATSSATLGLGLTGTLIGIGASNSLSVATSSLYSGTAGQFPYFSGTNALIGTSTLSIATNGTLTIDNGLAGDAVTQYGAAGYEWSIGAKSSDDTFRISSSTTLGTSDALTIDKNLLVTIGNASTTNLSIATNTYLTGITSALTLTGANGLIAEYAGTSCTNQFVRSLSALGAATCATVANTDLANSTISGIALGSNLADLTATNATLTFSGTYNGSTARTIGLNLANGNSWTALQQFANASSTQLSAATETFYIDSTGKVMAKDTTNAWSGRLSPTKGHTFNIATSTGTWTATSTPGVDISPERVMRYAGTFRKMSCTLNTFLGISVAIDGTPIAPAYIVASSTEGVITFTSANAFSVGSVITATAGTTTSATASSGVVRGSCTLDATEN